MISVLSIGFVIGMVHALEADHLAAVASFSVRGKSARDILWLGVSWGFGHTITLFLTVVPLFFFDLAISETVEARLEALVGAVLVFLGVRLIWRIRRERAHVHVHTLDDCVCHVHVHSHKDEPAVRRRSAHDRGHREKVSWQSLLVGLVHGIAGSSALLFYVNGTIEVKWLVIPLVLLFGLGSVLGMALVSQVIALPLHLVRRGKAWVLPAMQHVAAFAAVGVGGAFIFNGLA